MNQQERISLVDSIVANTPGTEQLKLQVRRELYGLSNEDLQKTADRYAQICAEAERKRRPQLEEAERRARELDESLAFVHIFRTPINGRGVLIDNEANRNLLRSHVDETKGDQLGPAWLKKALAENPALAKNLAWQSAKVLDPKWREQQAEAQDQQDRETFEAFAKSNGFSEVAANFYLAKSVLGSGFDQSTLAQAVQLGQLQLAPASPEQLAEWAQQAYEARVDHLQNYASPEELREAARTEAEQRRQAAQRAEQERSLAERAKADAAYGYPPLPEIHVPTGERIDAAWLNRISNTNLPLFKALLIKHGNFALTQRLKGLEA